MENTRDDFLKTLNLCKARPNDAPMLGEFAAKVYTITYGHLSTPETLREHTEISYSAPAILKDIKDPRKDVILATTTENIILGYAYLTRDTTEACISSLENTVELQRLYVDPAFQGKGLGKVLVAEVEGIARNEGFKNIWLGVWESALDQQRFYERLGYRRVGEHDFFVGDTKFRDLIMVKAL